MKVFYIFPVFLVSVMLLSGCASTVSSIKNDVDINLNENSGYLLIGVEIRQYIRAIEISGPRNIKLAKEDLDKFQNYFLVEMPAGQYQIDTIRYSSWYRSELESGYWDFEVNPGEISYVGHLKIDGFGSNVELQNRGADALVFMEQDYPNILSARKLRFRGPGQDKFFEKMEKMFAKESL